MSSVLKDLDATGKEEDRGIVVDVFVLFERFGWQNNKKQEIGKIVSKSERQNSKSARMAERYIEGSICQIATRKEVTNKTE